MLTNFWRASAGALVLVAGASIVPHVAFADATQIIVRCALAQACTSTKNTVGAGVQGIAAGATGSNAGVRGLDGSTNGGMNDGVIGSVTNGGFGVEGTSGNSAFGGVRGTATTGVGTEGFSNSSYGMYGASSSSFGVVGLSSTNIGLYGISGSAPGVYGTSSSGYGVQGSSSSNDAAHFAASSSGTAVNASSATGYGLIAVTGGSVGAYVRNSNGNGADVQGSNIGLLGRSNNFPLLLTNTAGTDLFYVDGSGNVFSHGTYQTFAATRSGQEATAYSTQTTTPNVEDIGSADLVNGVATVRLDPTFAASIDLHTKYHVFLTPGGDTRGLYVAGKTANGFIVRETQGGRGNLNFDYRIVAQATGRARDHMVLVAGASAGRPIAPPVVLRAKPESAVPAPQLPRKRASTKGS